MALGHALAALDLAEIENLTWQMKAALKAMRIKTDRREAEGVARPLRMGWFRPVHCKTVLSQEMRALLTSRKSVGDAIVDMGISDFLRSRISLCRK